MYITYLIGNGFDLSLGLKTSFFEFNEHYCSLNKDKDTQCICTFKQKISENKNLWSSVERALGYYTADFDSSDALRFRECLDNLHKELIDYLEKQNELFDVNGALVRVKSTMYKATVGLGDFLFSNSENQKEKLAVKNQPKIYQFINFNYTTVFDRCINTLRQNDSSRIEMWSHEGKTYFHSLGQLIHVHGTTSDSMILGVNDESQISNKELLDLENIREIMIKPIANQSVHNDKTNTCMRMIKSSDFIVVFGMSLGETDRIWWESIIQWLRDDPQHYLVIFAWKKDYSKAMISYFLDIEKEVRKLLLSYSDTPKTDSDLIIKQVSIMLNSEIFKI